MTNVYIIRYYNIHVISNAYVVYACSTCVGFYKPLPRDHSYNIQLIITWVWIMLICGALQCCIYYNSITHGYC